MAKVSRYLHGRSRAGTGWRLSRFLARVGSNVLEPSTNVQVRSSNPRQGPTFASRLNRKSGDAPRTAVRVHERCMGRPRQGRLQLIIRKKASLCRQELYRGDPTEPEESREIRRSFKFRTF